MRSSAAPWRGREHRALRGRSASRHALDEVCGEDRAAPRGVSHQRVVELGMDVQRLVRRERPRRRGPDHRVDAACRAAPASRTLRRASRAPHRRTGSRRRSPGPCGPRTRLRLRRAPSRSRSTSSPASGRGRHSPSRSSLPSARISSASLREVHRQVRMVPVAEHAEALEVARFWLLDLLGRVGAARAAASRAAGRFLPCCLLDLHLDRHAVAVPARHVGRVEAGQRLAILTMMSLRILLTAWPMWMSPFAYGGPSCSTKRGRPRARLRGCARRRLVLLPFLDPPGSRLARSPRIGNGVSGRFSVFL